VALRAEWTWQTQWVKDRVKEFTQCDQHREDRLKTTLTELWSLLWQQSTQHSYNQSPRAREEECGAKKYCGGAQL
jgi:hypothetical protein